MNWKYHPWLNIRYLTIMNVDQRSNNGLRAIKYPVMKPKRHSSLRPLLSTPAKFVNLCPTPPLRVNHMSYFFTWTTRSTSCTPSILHVSPCKVLLTSSITDLITDCIYTGCWIKAKERVLLWFFDFQNYPWHWLLFFHVVKLQVNVSMSRHFFIQYQHFK